MNVSQQNIDKVNAVINIEIANADYQEKVDKALHVYRQKANIPGFRKGMAPKGMIQKMVGKSILLDEINKLVSEQLFGYIRESNINILGEPLPSDTQKDIDFDTQKDFTFSFDVALAPAIDVELSQEDCVDFYQINVDEDMVKKQIEALAGRYGTQESVEVADEKAMLKGTLSELDDAGQVKEGGNVVENAVVSPAYFKNDEEKARFAGVKVGAKVVFNPSKSCDAHEAELASMLHIDKDKVADATGDYEFVVNDITGFKPAEMNQEFFDNVFGKDVVKTEEEFTAKIREMLAGQLLPESNYKFGIDARTVIENKVGNIELPEAFLKRWLVATRENQTAESVEDEFPKMLPELKWHLIKEQIVKKFEIKVEEADVLAMAKNATKAQFAQYGMMNIPDDMLENYSKEMLKNKETVRSLVDRATEDKIVAVIKDTVSLNVKEISSEDFYKMFENK